MAREIQKREKARRVWRLNKKEGIPVLEALESVDLGKDVYYRLKDEHEEAWEEEILTSEQIQEELEELQDQLRELREQGDRIEERFDEAEELAAELEQDVNWYERVGELEDRIFEQKMRLNNFAEMVQADLSTSLTTSTREETKERFEEERVPEGARVNFRDIARRVDQLESAVTEVQDAIQRMNDKVEQVREDARDKRSELSDRIKRKPDRLFDLF